MSHSTQEEKPVLVTKSAMTFALIIVGLLIATMNFVKVMGGGHEAGHGAHHTEATHETHGHEAATHHDDAEAHGAAAHEATDEEAAHAGH